MKCNSLFRRTVLAALILSLLSIGAVLPASRAQEKSLYERVGGYNALAAVVDDFIVRLVTDKQFEKFFAGHSNDSKKRIRQHILDPLGMTHTNLSTRAFKPSDDYAFPHEKLDGKLQVIEFQALDNAAPAGAINSCASDMAKWVQLQLSHGKFPNGDARLFSEARSREMWSAQTILPINDPPAPLAGLKANFAAYALGWGTHDYHGRKLVGHTGGVAGFPTVSVWSWACAGPTSPFANSAPPTGW